MARPSKFGTTLARDDCFQRRSDRDGTFAAPEDRHRPVPRSRRRHGMFHGSCPDWPRGQRHRGSALDPTGSARPRDGPPGRRPALPPDRALAANPVAGRHRERSVEKQARRRAGTTGGKAGGDEAPPAEALAARRPSSATPRATPKPTSSGPRTAAGAREVPGVDIHGSSRGEQGRPLRHAPCGVSRVGEPRLAQALQGLRRTGTGFGCTGRQLSPIAVVQINRGSAWLGACPGAAPHAAAAPDERKTLLKRLQPAASASATCQLGSSRGIRPGWSPRQREVVLEGRPCARRPRRRVLPASRGLCKGPPAASVRGLIGAASLDVSATGATPCNPTRVPPARSLSRLPKARTAKQCEPMVPVALPRSTSPASVKPGTRDRVAALVGAAEVQRPQRRNRAGVVDHGRAGTDRSVVAARLAGREPPTDPPQAGGAPRRGGSTIRLRGAGLGNLIAAHELRLTGRLRLSGPVAPAPSRKLVTPPIGLY